MSMVRRKIGSYYLVERIGSAGLGSVYLGIDPRRREKRAFKVLGKRISLWSLEYGRFIREVDAIRDLSHPGIVKVFENGVIDDCYYYAMEFMPGGNLARRMERGPMPVEEAADLFVRICSAVAYAHTRGVTHRDLKPANILFNQSGEPLISDFGIGRMLDLERRPTNESARVLEPIAYLAPEQRFGPRVIHRRADVYALGAILYEMLMGFPPLGDFPWPAQTCEGFPSALQTALEKCLHPDPNMRFADAAALLEALEKAPKPGGARGPEAASVPLKPVGEPPALKTDRIEGWFAILREGSARERLAVVREMVEKMSPAEAKTIVKLYGEEVDRVRWGLIRVLGELRIEAATPLILNDLNNSFYPECAIEALGKIGSEEAYHAIREYVSAHPEAAVIALVPMATTGKRKAIAELRGYLERDASVLRQEAVRALACIEAVEALQVLKDHLCVEPDEHVRAALFRAIHRLQGLLLPSMKPVDSPATRGLAVR